MSTTPSSVFAWSQLLTLAQMELALVESNVYWVAYGTAIAFTS